MVLCLLVHLNGIHIYKMQRQHFKQFVVILHSIP